MILVIKIKDKFINFLFGSNQKIQNSSEKGLVLRSPQCGVVDQGKPRSLLINPTSNLVAM